MGDPSRSSGRIGETLIDSERLHSRVTELGTEISGDYADRDLVMVGVLKGALIFMADLMRELTVPCEIDLMAVSSYGSATDSSGVVRILKDLDTSIIGRDVLIVEDIVDSGLTLQYLLRNLKARAPASVEVCALLTKPERRRVDTPIRYVGFEIPDRFASRLRARSRPAPPQPRLRGRVGGGVAPRGAIVRRAAMRAERAFLPGTLTVRPSSCPSPFPMRIAPERQL